jgi:hypothetical protein
MYYSRFLAGDTVNVWNEISNIEIAKNGNVPTDIQDVCKETVDRCYSNISLLHRKLIEVGYEFERPEVAFTASNSEDAAVLSTFQSVNGDLPMILRVWYTRFSSVSFSQAGGQLFYKGPRIASTPEVSGLGVGTVMLRLAPKDCLDLLERLKSEAEADGTDDSEFNNFYPVGGSSTSCSPKGFKIPCGFIDAEIFDDGLGPVTFVEDLRSIFLAGGFVFWHRYMMSTRKPLPPVSTLPNYELIIPYLQEGLQSI